MTQNLPALILDNLSTAIILLDSELRLRYVNPAAEMLLGLSARRAQGVSLKEAIYCSTEDLRDRALHSLRSGRPFTEHEIEIETPGKQQRVTVNCTVTPIIAAGGVSSVLLEVVELDRHLRISREEQIRNQHLLSRAVIRGMAHEIKNPLGGLRGAAQLLEAELESEDLKDYTHIIIGEADRLQKLVDRMLGPNGLPDKKYLDIHEVLEHVRQLVAAEAPPDVELKRDYDPSIPMVYGDRNLLIQAILNIVRNALQAIDGKGTITLRSRIERQFPIGQIRHRLVARADVIDTGPGIPKYLKEKLFYPMITGRDSGTGLGLSIAQTLVNLHKGLIEYKSRPGYTVFSVYIPIRREKIRHG
jgi:two-component system nitrogen regulation sensor histidine kinase GlnL